MNERAVATQVGMVLMFGITILAIGLIYMGAYPAIESYIKVNHNQEILSSFRLLRASLAKIAEVEVPSRVVESKTYEGYYSINLSGNITVGGTRYPVYSIRYKGEDLILSLENGGIFREVDGKSILLEPPFLYTSGNIVVLSIIDVYGIEGATAGKGVLRIKLTNLEDSSFNRTSNTTMVIESYHIDAWRSYLETQNFTIVSYSNSTNTLVARLGGGEIFYKVVPVKVDFLR